MQVYEYDLSKIEPVVAEPHFVDNVKPLAQMDEVRIDEWSKSDPLDIPLP